MSRANARSDAPRQFNLAGVFFLEHWHVGISQGSIASRIKVGLSFGAIGAYGSQAGQPGESRKLRLFNDTGEALENLRIRNGLTLRAKHFPTTATLIFAEMSDTADSAVEVMTSEQVQPYHITVANVTGSGSSKTMDLLVNGSMVQVRNLTTGPITVSIGLNVNDSYEIVSDGLSGLTFKLSLQATNASTANVLIFAARFLQTAPDLGGAPDDWGPQMFLSRRRGRRKAPCRIRASASFTYARLFPINQPRSQTRPRLIWKS